MVLLKELTHTCDDSTEAILCRIFDKLVGATGLKLQEKKKDRFSIYFCYTGFEASFLYKLLRNYSQIGGRNQTQCT